MAVLTQVMLSITSGVGVLSCLNRGTMFSVRYTLRQSCDILRSSSGRQIRPHLGRELPTSTTARDSLDTGNIETPVYLRRAPPLWFL